MDYAEYFATVAEIDYIHWQLGEMLKVERSLSGFARMIDQATGFDQQKMKDAKKLIARANKLKARIEREQQTA